jgi:hypothetical protein
MLTPTFAYENGTYTFTLWRRGPASRGELKQEKWIFDNHYVSMQCCYPHASTMARFPNAPFPYDGLLYYILAKPRNGGEDIFAWLETKDDYVMLKDKVNMINKADTVCTFCSKRPSEGCSEDHGDEMRE